MIIIYFSLSLLTYLVLHYVYALLRIIHVPSILFEFFFLLWLRQPPYNLWLLNTYAIMNELRTRYRHNLFTKIPTVSPCPIDNSYKVHIR